MACSYEQFEQVIEPSKFYIAGIPRIPFSVVAVVLSVPFAVMTLSPSTRWVAAGYVGFTVVLTSSAYAARYFSLRYWKVKTRAEREARIQEQLVNSVLSMFPVDPRRRREELAIELAAAAQDQPERRASASTPAWFASALAACLTAALAAAVKASVQTGAAVAVMAVIGASLFLLAKRLIDWVVPTRFFGHDGYVRLLRLAKRRVDLDALLGEHAAEPSANVSSSEDRRPFVS